MLQDAAGALLDGETPVTLPKLQGAAGTDCTWEMLCKGFVLFRYEPELKHKKKYSALL